MIYWKMKRKRLVDRISLKLFTCNQPSAFVAHLQLHLVAVGQWRKGCSPLWEALLIAFGLSVDLSRRVAVGTRTMHG